MTLLTTNMQRLFRIALFGLLTLGVSLLVALPRVSAAPRMRERKHPRKTCPVQAPQSLLIRSNFIEHGTLNAAAHERSLRYRAEQYGSIEGLGLDHYNKQRAYSSAVGIRFMGLPIQVHEKVAPALACVEHYIVSTCTAPKQRYVPRAIGGFRQTNTYRGGEVSNHLFGIAIDIDPTRNPCCGCVAPWRNDPVCRGRERSVFERTALPRCWIDSFERFGFYWLGRDPDLRDTMHFEFLGDPDALAQ